MFYIKLGISFLAILSSFLFGYIKKSTKQKEKDTFTNIELKSLKTKNEMQKASNNGVKTKEDLINKLKEGKF